MPKTEEKQGQSLAEWVDANGAKDLEQQLQTHAEQADPKDFARLALISVRQWIESKDAHKKLPAEFAEHFGGYQEVGFDAHSGEPVSWGFVPRHHLGDELFKKVEGNGRHWLCIDHINKGWVLVTRTLTKSEAIAKYGPLTEVKRGPRGGFRSVTYGKTTFCSRELQPTAAEEIGKVTRES